MYVCLLFTSPEMGSVPYFLIHGTMLLNARKIRDHLIRPEETGVFPVVCNTTTRTRREVLRQDYHRKTLHTETKVN